MKKIVNVFLIALIIFCFFAPSFPTKAAAVYEVYIENGAGNNLALSVGTYKEAYLFAQEKEKEDQNNNLVIYADGKTVYATYGLVNFRTKASSGENTSYTIEFNGKNGYTNGYYGADGAFLGTNEDGTLVRFMQAGVIGWVNANEVEIINMNSENYKVIYTNSYIMTLDDTWQLRHNITTNVREFKKNGDYWLMGQERPYGMKDKTYYMSYDGHYFYEENFDNYRVMIRDYKAGVRTNSINPNNPYYNYYQFLPHRSISNYTSAQLQQDFSGYTSKPTSYPASPGQSLLFGEDISFIQYQNEFGANAMLMLGVAKNESAFGTSNIAINKNNLFGHGAYDSAPGASANRYATVAQSIYIHAKSFISEGYLDPCDGYTVNGNGASAQCHQGRYYGGNLGDKASGINVKYASDPYWGEKAAKNYYLFDKKYGLQDYEKYSIGIKTSTNSYPIKAEPNNSSATLYMTGNSNSYPMIILETVTGEAIGGNTTWYKIQTDPVLNSTRTGIVQDQGVYDFNHNVAYIHSSYVGFVRNGNGSKAIYTIKFNPNGGKFTDNITSTKSLSVEEYVIPEVNAPTKDGYIFIGWDKEIVGATENATYTAVWKAKNTYDITFDADGGKFSDGSTTQIIKVDENQVPVFSMIPSKDGYIFTGWNKELAKATENTTYKAMYKKIETYQITFDANGGFFIDQTSSKTISVEKGKKPDFNMEPTKEGFYFIGWDKEIVNATENTIYRAMYQSATEVEDNLQASDGLLVIDSISNKDGKLHIKGFQTIESIDNNLNTEIQYMMIFVDINNPENVYVDFIRRITDNKEIPYPSYGMGGKDYSYAWFSYETDFDGLEDGNYIAGIMAFTNHEYSVSILNNRMFAPQVTSYSGKKEVLMRNIYYDNEQPIEFIIRTDKLADKNTKTYTYNQFDQVLELNFKDNNLLHMNGYTYSYGMDLSESANVSRKIIFENQETFQTTTFKLEAIKGLYDPILPASDSLSKALAWYNADLDLSSLEKGTYRIYLATSSNISDISELTDLFNQDFSKVVATINGKKYSVRTNLERGNILELIVS